MSKAGSRIVDMDIEKVNLQTVEETKKVQKTLKVDVPIGYIPIELSVGGFFGIPKIIHCRNFSTGDLIDLSLFNENAIPEQIIPVLNSLIFEKIDISEWPDKAIIELLVRIYVNYFTPILREVKFPWDETDIEWLKNHKKEEEASKLQTGIWKPVFDLDLTTIKTKTVPENVKPYVVVRKKAIGKNPPLEVKFLAYPRYGDIIVVKKAVENKFSEEEKKYAKIRQQVEMRDRFIREDKDVSHIDPISDKDFIDYQIYEAKRSVYIAKATQALYLIGFNGEDLSDKSIEQKMIYINDPQFDVKVSKIIEKQYESLDFGLDSEVDLKNPITGEPCKRRFSFRLMDIISSIQSSKSDEYDISYDE